MYEEAGRYIIRASSFHGCTKSLFYALEGAPKAEPPAAIRRAWDEGREMEDELVRRGLDGKFRLATDEEVRLMGFRTDSSGQVVLEIPWDTDELDLRVRCHPDGIAYSDEGSAWVVEAKFVGPELFEKLKNGPKGHDNYEYQFAIEMWGTGLPGVYIVGLKDPETRELKDVAVSRFTEPTLPFSAIQDRLEQIGRHIIDGTQPEKCDVKMFPCPYWEMHDKLDPTSVWYDPPYMKLPHRVEMENALVELREVKRLEKEAAERKKKAMEAYRLSMEGKDAGRYEHGTVKFRHVVQHRKGNVNWNEVMEVYPDFDPDDFRGKGYTVDYPVLED